MPYIVGGNDIINFSSGSNVANVWGNLLNTGSAWDNVTDANGSSDTASSVNLFNAMVTLGSAYGGTVDFFTSAGTLRLEKAGASQGFGGKGLH